MASEKYAETVENLQQSPRRILGSEAPYTFAVNVVP
jgi:hypothetical protein